MGLRQCPSEHAFVASDLGVGLRRLECERCSAVVIELDEVDESGGVTAPGLFRPSPPTIFSVLGEEQRAERGDGTTDSAARGYAFDAAVAGR